MDEIVNTIQLTLNSEYTKEAESKLALLKTQPNFISILLQIIDSDTVFEETKHSASIIFKNLVKERWVFEESEKQTQLIRDSVTSPAENNDLALADKKFIEGALINSIINSRSILIRDMLLECLQIILKRSFPIFFSQILPQISQLLLAREEMLLSGLLIIMTAFKSQELKGDERFDFLLQQLPLNTFFAHVLQKYSVMDTLDACNVQIGTYKILVHIINRKRFVKFFGGEPLKIILDSSMRLFIRPSPPNVPRDDGLPSPWSKSRKWAIRIFCELVKTKNSKGSKQFKNWFIENYCNDVINCIFTLFGQLTQNIVVSDYVLQYAILYLRFCISKLSSYKILSKHLTDIVGQIFTRLLAYTEKLSELVQTDPQTFVEDYCVDDYMLYPESAINSFLRSLSKHRPESLSVVVNVCMQLLAESGEPQKYAAFSILGYIAPSLVKHDGYKNDMEKLFVAHVFPAMKSGNILVRYKAYWLLETLIKVPFRTQQNELFVAEMIVAGIVNDTSLPVQYQAVMLFDKFMTCFDEQVLNTLIPYIKTLIVRMMSLIKDLNCHRTSLVMEKMFDIYSENIAHVAVDIVQGSLNIIKSLLSESSLSDVTPTVSGLITAVDTVVESLNENLNILTLVEPHVDEILQLSFNDDIMHELSDDLAMLLATVTTMRVNPIFWKYFYRFCEFFPLNVGICPLEEMTDFVHNFITLDIDAFLQRPETLQMLMGVIDQTLSSTITVGGAEDIDAKRLAMKLYELILISAKGKLSQENLTAVLNVVFKIYSSVVHDPESVKNSCLMTFVSALYCDFAKAMALCSSVASGQTTLINEIIAKWVAFIGGNNCNRHQMKVSLLVIIEFINSSDVLARQYLGVLMPVAVTLCSALRKNYNNPKKDEEEEYLDDYDDSSSLESVEYGDDRDAVVVDEDLDDDESFDEDYDDDDSYYDEVYSTLIDSKEYERYELIVFAELIKGLQERDAQYFYSLVGILNGQQQQDLKGLCDHVDQVKLGRQGH